MADLIALIALALVFGGMTFFSAVVAPLVFTRLPAEHAGAFIRALFPWYYLVMGGAALVALAALLPGGVARPETVLTAVATAGFVAARQVLMPAINRARDAGAEARFQGLHRGSVVLNALQWLAVTTALVLLAAP